MAGIENIPKFRVKYVMYLLKICGLWFRKNRKQSQWFGKVLTIIVAICFHIATAVFSAQQINRFIIGSLSLQMVSILIFMKFCTVALWVIIYLKQKQFIKVMEEMTLIYMAVYKPRTQHLPRLNYFLPIATFMLPFLMSLCITMIKAIRNEDIASEHKEYMFGKTFVSDNISQYCIYMSFQCLDHYCIMLFPNAASMFMAFLCDVLNEIYLAFWGRIKTNFKQYLLNKDYVSAFKMYRKIRSMKDKLESAISLPIFFLLSKQFCLLFVAVTVSYKGLLYNLDPVIQIAPLTYIIVPMICITLIIFSASAICASNNKIFNEIRKIVEDVEIEYFHTSTVGNIEGFLSNMVLPTEDALTVWGMVPITRGMMLTTLATLTTYGVILVQFTS